jgi:hypothetical protein
VPVRARIIGKASDDRLSTFLKKLAEFNASHGGLVQQAIAEAVPTVQVLLSHASTSSPVEPKASPYTPRAYKVDAETQERIDDNTIVGVDGTAIRVGVGDGDPHDRPLVPLGQKLEEKWRAAIAQKINGFVRRTLALEKAVGFLQGALAAGPVSAVGFGKRARAAGVSTRALKEARGKLGVKSIGKGKKAVLSL